VSRIAERQISFADWELVRQGLCLEPLLRAISDFLDEQKDIIEQVRSDLTRGLKKAETGRSGLTPQQVLRSLVLMRVKNWNYRELRERIADGCTLRQFTDFYCLPVPRHDAFHRGFNRLTPETLKAINDLVVQAAVELGLEDGQKLRVDTTVVQTDIHHPTDNTLLWDVVRVVTRLIGRLAEALERRRIKGFRDRTRSARRRMQEIQRMTTRQRQDSGRRFDGAADPGRAGQSVRHPEIAAVAVFAEFRAAQFSDHENTKSSHSVVPRLRGFEQPKLRGVNQQQTYDPQQRWLRGVLRFQLMLVFALSRFHDI
jgi:Transposase domain (DUF772)